jgi:hypothetical protein
MRARTYGSGESHAHIHTRARRRPPPLPTSASDSADCTTTIGAGGSGVSACLSDLRRRPLARCRRARSCTQHCIFNSMFAHATHAHVPDRPTSAAASPSPPSLCARRQTRSVRARMMRSHTRALRSHNLPRLQAASTRLQTCARRDVRCRDLTTRVHAFAQIRTHAHAPAPSRTLARFRRCHLLTT